MATTVATSRHVAGMMAQVDHGGIISKMAELFRLSMRIYVSRSIWSLAFSSRMQVHGRLGREAMEFGREVELDLGKICRKPLYYCCPPPPPKKKQKKRMVSCRLSEKPSQWCWRWCPTPPCRNPSIIKLGHGKAADGGASHFSTYKKTAICSEILLDYVWWEGRKHSHGFCERKIRQFQRHSNNLNISQHISIPRPSKYPSINIIN